MSKLLRSDRIEPHPIALLALPRSKVQEDRQGVEPRLRPSILPLTYSITPLRFAKFFLMFRGFEQLTVVALRT